MTAFVSTTSAVAAPVSRPIIRLNAFQALMRAWSQLHPYNAGHVMRVSGRPDREHWKQSVEAVIRELGLGTPRWIAPDAMEVLPVTRVAVEESRQDPETFFSEQLNRPFSEADLPIRFYLLRDPGDGSGEPAESSHCLAAVYDHWVADTRAMRALMHRIFERYERPDAAPALPGLTLESPDFDTLFGHHMGRFAPLASVAETLKSIWHHRHGYRVPMRNPLDFTCRVVYRTMPESVMDRLPAYARACGATVTDIYLALVGQAMGRLTSDDRGERSKRPAVWRREQVGIGTIADIRDAASQPLDRVFSLFLSGYAVMLDQPEARRAEEVIHEVSAATSRLKRTKAPVRSYRGLILARFWRDFYDSPRFRATLLPKTVPVLAGITNVNLAGTWADSPRTPAMPPPAGQQRPRALDYLRFGPTGPMTPICFAFTTVRGRLNLCVTYRTIAFGEEQIRDAVQDFIDRLQSLVAGRPNA